MKDNRIFKASEIDSNKSGWIADLSPENVVNPDFYYFFRTQRQAKKFIDLVDGGMNAQEARYNVEAASEAAAALGRIGGLKKSPIKTLNCRENGKKGGRPSQRAKLEENFKLAILADSAMTCNYRNGYKALAEEVDGKYIISYFKTTEDMPAFQTEIYMSFTEIFEKMIELSSRWRIVIVTE